MKFSKKDLLDRWAAVAQIDRSARLISVASQVRGDLWAQQFISRDFDVAFPVIDSASAFMREFQSHEWAVGEAQEFGVGLVVAGWLSKRMLAVSLVEQARKMAHLIGLKREEAASVPALQYLTRTALSRYSHGSPHLKNRGLVFRTAREGQLTWESIPMRQPEGVDATRYAQQTLHHIAASKPGEAAWAEDCDGHFIFGWDGLGKSISVSPLLADESQDGLMNRCRA